MFQSENGSINKIFSQLNLDYQSDKNIIHRASKNDLQYKQI